MGAGPIPSRARFSTKLTPPRPPLLSCSALEALHAAEAVLSAAMPEAEEQEEDEEGGVGVGLAGGVPLSASRECRAATGGR